MSDEKHSTHDAATYWDERYDVVDISRSGHVDLPGEYNAWLYRRKHDHVARAIARTGSSLRGGKLLEIAAGSGAWMSFWKSQGIAGYLGVDISERAIAHLQHRFPEHRFLRLDLNGSDLEQTVGAGYDCVSAIDVLYYVVDDRRFRAVLADFALALKSGGLLVIHDQFVHGPTQDHGYIKWRSLEAYASALTAAGFEILYRRPTFFFMVQTVDLKGFAAKAMTAFWNRILQRLIWRFPRLAGATGYVVDTAVCSLLREGPSMELMICRKRS